MASVTGLTAERMLEIEAACIVAGAVVLDELHLTRHDGSSFNAGNVRGPRGFTGLQGVPGTPGDPGPKGDQGIQGVKGDQGIQGVKGDQGIQGVKGDQGIQGVKGDTGPQGVPGEATNAYVQAQDKYYRQMSLLQRLFFGGGVRKVTSVGVAWSQTFIVIGHGRDTNSPAGYHNITMPPNGTSIPVYGKSGVSSVAVANGVIPMGTWDALYYEIPLTGSGGTVDANFRIVGESATRQVEIPANWVLVCVSNGYTLSPRYLWGDGRAMDPWKNLILGNSWVSFDPNYGIPSYRLGDDGQVHLKGMMKNGVINTTFAQLPTELGADTINGSELFIQLAGGGMARLDVTSAGALWIVFYASGGGNSAVSLANMSWFPKGS